MSENSWIGVDFDGTLSHYGTFEGADVLGPPVAAMRDRVRAWLAEGREVRIVTARAATENNPWPDQVAPAVAAIKAWCIEHFGQELPITATKDYAMIELWDDRCVQVEKNTGVDLLAEARASLLAERELADMLATALRLTKEYVDGREDNSGLLPDLPGWSHFDALSAYREVRDAR